jgi:predicted enzyme related to lactoylglutathione lyase
VAERPTGTPCWADIAVPDVERAKQFYGAMFGWDCRTDPREEAGGYTMCYLDNLPAAAITPIWNEGSRPGWSVYLASDSADATAEAIAANGGQVVMGPMDVFDAGRLAMAIDPTGAAFGVWQKGTHRGIETEYPPGAISWVELVTGDTDAAAAFYGAVFGLDTAPFPGMDGYRTWQKDGVTRGGLIALDAMRSGEMGSHWRVHLAVADADATCRQADELGGTVEVPPFDIEGVGRSAFIRDPFDLRVGIIQPAQG